MLYYILYVIYCICGQVLNIMFQKHWFLLRTCRKSDT